jgi:hypothetical protein
MFIIYCGLLTMLEVTVLVVTLVEVLSLVFASVFSVFPPQDVASNAVSVVNSTTRKLFVFILLVLVKKVS